MAPGVVTRAVCCGVRDPAMMARHAYGLPSPRTSHLMTHYEAFLLGINHISLLHNEILTEAPEILMKAPGWVGMI